MFFKKNYLFATDIDPRCAYCKKGTPVSDKDISCRKYGIVNFAHSCKRFDYDPLKRVPAKPAKMSKRFSSEDFILKD